MDNKEGFFFYFFFGFNLISISFSFITYDTSVSVCIHEEGYMRIHFICFSFIRYGMVWYIYRYDKYIVYVMLMYQLKDIYVICHAKQNNILIYMLC